MIDTISRSRLKGHHFPAPIISHAVWAYHRFALSLRDVEDLLAERGITVSYETIQAWVGKFGTGIAKRIRAKRERPSDKWHLDEMSTRINGEKYVLWRAVDSEGYELDILIQKRKNKKAAIRFLKRLLGSHPEPRVIITDKLRSYL